VRCAQGAEAAFVGQAEGYTLRVRRIGNPPQVEQPAGLSRILCKRFSAAIWLMICPRWLAAGAEYHIGRFAPVSGLLSPPVRARRMSAAAI